MHRHLRGIQVLFLLGICGFLTLHFINNLWTLSADLAHHDALVAHLMEYWRLPAGDELSLGEMNYYPPGSHIATAVMGTVLGSPVAGLQVVTLLSLLALWSGIAFALQSLPRRMSLAVGIVLAILLLGNHFLMKLELHGEEVITNFFFAQLVAQSIVIVLLAAVVRWDRQGIPRIFIYFLLAGGSWILVWIHLLPALELLGVLFLLIVVDGAEATRGQRARSILPGLACAIVTLALIVRHPGFRAMLAISEHDGTMRLRYTPDLERLGLLCAIVCALSGLALLKWRRDPGSRCQRRGLLLKYMGLYGISVASLCGTQIFLYAAFGLGSSYAAFKYAFGLNTLLLLQLALGPAVMLGPGRLDRGDKEVRLPGFFLGTMFPGVLVFVAVFSVLPAGKTIATAKLVRAERIATSYRQLLMARIAGKEDYAVGIRDIGATGDYLISVAALKAPRTANTRDLLLQKPFSKRDRIRYLVTSENSKPWDVPDCRRHLLDGSLVVVDAACVFAHAALICEGDIDLAAGGNGAYEFATGFSQPEADGLWNDGAAATITCRAPSAPNDRPSKVRIASLGFVVGDHKQRVGISINEGPPREVRYETAGEWKSTELSLPEPSGGRWEFRFVFPNSVSPKDLGLSTDRRKLAVKIRSMSFE